MSLHVYFFGPETAARIPVRDGSIIWYAIAVLVYVRAIIDMSADTFRIPQGQNVRERTPTRHPSRAGQPPASTRTSPQRRSRCPGPETPRRPTEAGHGIANGTAVESRRRLFSSRSLARRDFEMEAPPQAATSAFEWEGCIGPAANRSQEALQELQYDE